MDEENKEPPMTSLGKDEEQTTPLQPEHPIPFPTPIINPGTKTDVTVRITETGQQFTTQAILNFANLNYAYIEDPTRQHIETNLGYVTFYTKISRVTNTKQQEQLLLFEIPKHTNLRIVAVKVSCWEKIIAFRDAEKEEDPLKEVGAMQFGGDNKHLLGYNELISDNKYLYMVMPFLCNGNLLTLITNAGTELTERLARLIFQQLLSILHYMKQQGIVHRDISSENIMLNDDGHCILIDMGMAIRVPKHMEGQPRAPLTEQGRCGKHAYMAPEIFDCWDSFDGYGVDLWSTGIVLFAMLSGGNQHCPDGDRLLYHMPSPFDPIFMELIEPDGKGLERIVSRWKLKMSTDAIDLLQSIFQIEPDRPPLEEVMTHPWVTDPDVATQDEMMEFIISQSLE